MARDTILALATLALTACPNDPGPSTSDTATIGAETMTTSMLDPSSSSSTDGDEPSDTSSGGVTTAPADTSTGDEVSGCNVANPCDVGFCVAPYADNDRGEFTCVADCVEPGDETSWCFDDAACCDAEATCTERGYCVSPDAGTSG